ncbi:hypothetical protein [Hyalangium versicolor]|uniref:hypothetical protein n=1 Tax=Hyalangium versicolor TaxID=2861190 RepID=UPI001CCDA0F3|nr:hypothetical protein [Hyalangium versicolor]
MRWLTAGVVVLSAMVMPGCPSEFGKDGRISRAVRKDAQENLIIKSCSDTYRDEVCNGPNRNPKKCEECGG